ncbi:MAG: hypothetical protein ABW275_01140 [Hansschlegelia sp.]
MIEPMLARLAGCLLCGGLLAGLVMMVDAPRAAQPQSVVVAQTPVPGSFTLP